MRKYIVATTVIIVLGMIVSVFVFDGLNNSSDYARITEVDYKAVVVDEPNSNGKIIVTERLTFEIHAANKNNLFWELWRDLPESYIDGVKVNYKVNSVKQIYDDGSDPLVYKESPILYWEDDDFINVEDGLGPGKWYHSEGPYDKRQRQYECVLFYVDGLFRETVVFEIEYEMYNASLRYNDSSELYLSFYSGQSINYLNSFKAQILFPTEKMPRQENYYAHTYGTNAHSFPFVKSDTINPDYYTFLIELDKEELSFSKYNQYIEFALISHGEDKHIFTQYASENIYYHDDVLDEIRNEQAKYEAIPHKFETIKKTMVILAFIGSILIIVLSILVEKRKKRNHNFYKPRIEIEQYRNIPSDLDPSFAAELVFCKHDSPKNISDGYAAVMLSLVSKGYIELNKIRNGEHYDYNNTKIIITHKSTKPLTKIEELYFNLINRHARGNEVSMLLLQTRLADDYENTTSFMKNIKKEITNIGVFNDYFQKPKYKQLKEYGATKALVFWIIGLLIVVFGNLFSSTSRLGIAHGTFFILGISFMIASIYISQTTKKDVLLTQFGEDEYAKWRGLYNFLNSEDIIKKSTVFDLARWEQFLIYATAFGISEKVIEALKINDKQINLNNSLILGNSYYRSPRFYTSAHSFNTATRTAVHTSLNGGHSGYGGGGRGGGGGGGGH